MSSSVHEGKEKQLIERIKQNKCLHLPRIIQASKRLWILASIDTFLLLIVDYLILVIYPSEIKPLPTVGIAIQILLTLLIVFACRFYFSAYRQVWRYAVASSYLKLCMSDFVAGMLYAIVARVVLPPEWQITFIREMSIIMLSLLCALGIRSVYQYLREKAVRDELPTFLSAIMNKMLGEPCSETTSLINKISIAIVGAGRVGVMLAEELINNPRSAYRPYCFIEVDREKIGREIMGIRVLSEKQVTVETLQKMPIQEVVFALPHMDVDKKKRLFNQYKESGLKIKVYDYPLEQLKDTSKRTMREFDIEELLFRKPREFLNTKLAAYYHDKVILISGGGGSIGSELCRQIAKMKPKLLIILDIYENNAYDIQQELRIVYGDSLNLQVEIASVRDLTQLEKIFSIYKPEIVLHAAAHKHVPLMEHNCSEAIKNNVFGTLNIADMAEKYGAEKFILISTDKAVNPTNVMGASKRMCEMIVQSRFDSKTCFSATRFGNVLGSNGSVIPLFKRQIMNGGPITLTDKRIIRYFMTISEASQLVLQSATMALRGELYVLDMGKPIKILELAENMIRLSGFEPYRDIDIIETGLRPGEKLYEELLIKTEDLDKTDNNLIFIERDQPLTRQEIAQKLVVLRNVLDTNDDASIMNALKQVVPTYKSSEEYNSSFTEKRELMLAAQRSRRNGNTEAERVVV